jgi:hypothetical protein
MHSSCHFVHSPLALSCFSVLQETLSMICVISRPRPSWMRSTPCFEAMETKKGRKNVYGSAASWEVTYFLSRTSCNSAASQVNDIQVVLSELLQTNAPSSTTKRSGWTSIFWAIVKAVFRTRCTAEHKMIIFRRTCFLCHAHHGTHHATDHI